MFSSDTFRKSYSPELPFGRFLRNVVVLSIAGILPFLLAYVLTTPSFTMMLVTNTTALGRFLRQIMTNGFPVVVLVNYLGFVFTYVALKQTGHSRVRSILSDSFLRGVIFLGAHVLVYVFSADLFGSFGGDRRTALSVVGPTLERSFLFENISGVYLYALVPGTFIAHLAILSQNGSRLPELPVSRAKWIAMLSSLLPVPVVTILSFALGYMT